MPSEVTDAEVEAFANEFWAVNSVTKYTVHKEHIRAALTAALAVREGVEAVAIKPLEWENDEFEPGWWTAFDEETQLGYEARTTGRGKIRVRGIDKKWADFEGDIDAAKAAFQADFEKRIRSTFASPALDGGRDG